MKKIIEKIKWGAVLLTAFALGGCAAFWYFMFELGRMAGSGW